MTLRTLVSRLAKAEGKKKQVSVGNIREILSILIQMDVKDKSAENSALLCLMNEVNKQIDKNEKKKKKN